MARIDTGLLVVTGGVSGQLQNFSSQVLKNGSNIDWGSGSDAKQRDKLESIKMNLPLGVVSLAQQAVQTTDWELKSSTARARLGFSAGLGLSTFSTS